MPKALQIKRGLKANLPAVAALGEPLLATDSRELYIGTGAGIYKVGDVVFSSIEPPVELEKVWIDTTNNKIYRAADDGLTWVSIGGAGSGVLSADFTVLGVTQGAYSDGSTIPAGTPLEAVVRGMLSKVIPPSYVSPTLQVTGTGELVVEAGTIISPTVIPALNLRDGGEVTSYTLKKDGIDILTNAVPINYTDEPLMLGDTSISYSALASYGMGPVKNDNQGNPNPSGQILAGSVVSNQLVYTGKRRLFYAADAEAVPTDSSSIRDLPNSILGVIPGQNITINVPAGTTRIVLAYPATIQNVTTIRYVDLGNCEVKDTFQNSIITVYGVNDFTAVDYKVYIYVPAVPFSDPVTYNVTI